MPIILLKLFIKGLRNAVPPIIPATHLEDFIQTVFFNVFKIRTHTQKLIELLQKRQNEMLWNLGRIMLTTGDISLLPTA